MLLSKAWLCKESLVISPSSYCTFTSLSLPANSIENSQAAKMGGYVCFIFYIYCRALGTWNILEEQVTTKLHSLYSILEIRFVYTQKTISASKKAL